MATNRPTAISVKQLSGAVDAAVKAAAKKHTKFKPPTPEAELIIDPYWLIGFILREELLAATLGETQAFANEVAGHLQGAGAGFHSAAIGGKPAQGAFYAYGGHIIMGFRPFPEDVVGLRE